MKSFIGNTSSIGMLNGTRLVAYTSAVCLFVFVTLLAFPVTSTSEEAIATTGTALPSTTTLTLSSSNDYASVNVAPNSAQGTFAVSNANGTAGFSVTTNNFTGYTLSIASSDDAGRLENYTHDYISSISSNLSEADFSGANNTTYNNKWGFKPNSYVSNNTVVDNTGNNAVFLPSPTTIPTVLNVTSAANTTDDEYTLGLGIRADLLLPSGVYSKTLNLIALANVVSYTISFDKNTADTVTNMPSAVSGTTSATGITIPNTTPARTDYTFEGWCDVVSQTGRCDGNAFQPGGTFGIDQTTSNDTTLYAVWKPVRTMQNVYSWMNDLSDGDSVEAYDVRDDKVYSVAKIDGEIWMAANLELDGGTALYSDTSNVPSGYPSNGNTPYYTLPASSMSGFDDNAGAFVYNSNNTECGQDSPCYSYYSFVAATAGDNPSSGVAANDICPKGWQLPAREDYERLTVGLTDGSDLINSVWGGVYSGYLRDNAIIFGGEASRLWTSTAASATNAYNFNLNSDSLSTTYNSKQYGRSIRCMVKQTMQAVTIDYLEDRLPNVGDTLRLIDERDGNEYPITRTDDNNFWMTSNLDLAGGTTITPADSNVASNYTLPASSTSGFDDDSTAYVYNSDNTACGDGAPCYSYYSFVAATAGVNPSDGNSAYDICPSGWRLPTSNEFAALATTYSTGAALAASPWYGEYAGRFTESSFGYGGSRGRYWSSSAYDTNNAMTLYFEESSANPTLRYTKGSGYSVRCIIKKPYMQDYSYSELSNMLSNVGDSMVLYDRRDDESYNVAKLADGKIWLLDNLRLDLTDTTVKANLTSSTTNASDTTLNYLKNGGGTTSDQYATAGVANWTSSYSYSAPLINTASKDNTGTGGYEAGKYGVYYNYCAASAGSYCYGDGTSYGAASGDATEDICPKGWRMPTGGESGEYQALYMAYNSNNTSFVNALHTPLSGDFYDGSAYDQGSYGGFWSSSFSDDSAMYYLAVHAPNAVYPQQYNDIRVAGYSVRCVLDASISDVTTMQQFGSLGPSTRNGVINSMTTGQAYTLTDTRDNESYSIAKLADGKVWLLDNLRLDLTNATVKANLKSSTTNASDATLNYLKNGGGTTSDQYATAGVSTNWNGSYSYSAPRIGTSYKNTTGAGGYEAGKYGVYYNYCAASAGSYCYGNGTSSGSPSGNATEDICPKGWRMPTGGASGEYQALYAAYNSDNTNFINALRTPLSGIFLSGSTGNLGEDGIFWSSTYYNNDDMYILDVYYPDVYSQDYFGREHGLSVRCILDNTSISDITTMQQFGSLGPSAKDNVMSSMIAGQAYTLTDARDNQAYSIARLADDHVWLLENLRLNLVDVALADLTGKTNASDTSLTYLKNGGGTTSDQYATAGVAAWGSSNSYSAPLINTDYKDDTGTGGYEAGKYGVYYNYCAASAGSYCYGDGTSSGSPSGNATEDICPKGWRMPTGGLSGEYQALDTAYNSTYADFVNALHTPLSGYFYNGSASNQGSRGYFWSSTRFSDYDMYILNVTTSSVSSWRSTSIRDRGFSVRCILQ